MEAIPIVGPHDQPTACLVDQPDLPDRWCFGLAHPYIQRLIFLAGTLELNAEDLRSPEAPRSTELPAKREPAGS